MNYEHVTFNRTYVHVEPNNRNCSILKHGHYCRPGERKCRCYSLHQSRSLLPLRVVLKSMLLAKIPPSLPGPGRSGQFEGHLGPPLSKEKNAYVQFIIFYTGEVWRKI